MLLKEHIEKWLLTEKNRKVKKYVHFDLKPDLSIWVNTSKSWITQDPQSFFEEFFKEDTVAKRGFWPFIHFTKETRKYKKNPKNKYKIGGKVKDVWFISKERPIHFASYFDSYIYSFSKIPPKSYKNYPEFSLDRAKYCIMRVLVINTLFYENRHTKTHHCQCL